MAAADQYTGFEPPVEPRGPGTSDPLGISPLTLIKRAPAGPDDPLGIYPLRVVGKEAAPLSALKKEAAQRKPAALAASKIKLPQGYRLDAPASSLSVEKAALPERFMQTLPTNPASTSTAPATPAPDDFAAQTRQGLQTDRDFLVALGHNFGIGKDELLTWAKRMREHPVEGALEMVPAYAGPKAILGEGKRVLGELGEAGKALGTEGQPLSDRLGAAASHAVSAIPLIGAAKDAALDEYVKAGGGPVSLAEDITDPKKYLTNLKIATDPKVLAATTGAAIQAGTLLAGAAERGYKALGDAYEKRATTPPEFLPPSPELPAPAVAAEPPTLEGRTGQPQLPPGRPALPAPTEGLTPAEQELEKVIDDRVSEHPETEVKVQRDLQNIPPEDRQAVLDSINQEGIEAYRRGDKKAAAEAVQHAWILKGIMQAEERAARAARIAARPDEATPEESPTLFPPAEPEPPTAVTAPEAAPQPAPRRARRAPVATAEAEQTALPFSAPAETEAPLAVRETPAPEAAAEDTPQTVGQLADEIESAMKDQAVKDQMVKELGANAVNKAGRPLSNKQLALKIAMQRLGTGAVKPKAAKSKKKQAADDTTAIVHAGDQHVGRASTLDDAKSQIQDHMAANPGNVVAPVAAPAPPVADALPAPNSPVLNNALTAAGLHDPSTSRVISRAIKQGSVTSSDQLNQILRIAKAIKAMDPRTTNTAAMIEATQYGGLPQLEATAVSGDAPPEAAARAEQVWDAVMKSDASPYLSMARVSGGKVKIGADPKALAEVLGSSLYGKDPVTVVVKELTQNAWDAIRQSKGAKEVTIDFDSGRDSLTISDTGKGMTRKELETVFTDLGRTGKLSQADASGGFGIAKAAPFMMAKRLTVTTVVEEKGKFYQHSFVSTPDEIVGSGVDIITSELPSSPAPATGTRIEAQFDPETSGAWNAQQFARKSMRSLNPPGKLTVTGLYESGKPKVIPEVGKTPLATTTTPGAKLNLHVSPDSQTAQRWDSIPVEINNNGIYQFEMDVYPPAEGMKVPSRIAIDVKATVKERDPNYPFMANREDFRNEDLKRDLRDLITKHVFAASADKHKQDVADAINGLPAIKIGATDIPVFDSGKRMTGAEMQQLLSNPAFIDLAHTIHQVTRQTIDKLQSADLQGDLKGLGNKIKKIGIVFSDKLHGVHITDPLNETNTLLFVNPFQYLKGSPERAASTIWHTIKHEIIHDKVKGHSESFTSAEVAVSGALGSRSELAGIQELEDVYADPDNPGAIRPDLSAAIQLYETSRGRAETARDIFGGEGLDTGVHAGTKNSGPNEDRLRAGGEGAVPSYAEPLKAKRPDSLEKLKAEAKEKYPVRKLDLPESARRPIKSFVSPNTSNLESLEQAQAAMDSMPHKLMYQESSWLLNELGSKVKPRNATGIWEDGAENTLLHEFPRDTDHDLVTYHNAILAKAGWQKFMLNFFPDEDGDNILFRLKLPKDAGTPAEITKVLAQHGIEASTILSERDGHAVMIATTGKDEPDTEFAVQNAVAQLGGTDGAVVRTHGRSDYVGEDDRDRAEELFTRIIEDKEKLHPEWRKTRLRLESRPGYVDLRRLVREAEKLDEPLDYLKDEAERRRPIALEPGVDPEDVVRNRKNNLNWDDIKDYLLPVEREAYEKKPELQRKIVSAVNMMPNVDEWDAAVKAGKVGHLWYERSARAFDALISSMPEAFEPKDKEKFLNFVSALSPVQTVRLNLMMAIDLWDKWNKAGRPTDVEWSNPKKFTGVADKKAKLYRLMAGLEKEEVPPEERGGLFRGKRGSTKKRSIRGVDLDSRLYNAIRALQGQPLSGPKVSAFAPNLGKNIDKSTNDTWMAVFADTDPNTINQKHLYDAVSAHVRIAAEKNDIPTRQAQAAIWSFIKSLAELSGWGANRWIPPQEIIDRNILNPESVEAKSQDFADLMLHDYGIRAKLSKIGADLNVLDRKIARFVPAKPTVDEGSIKELAERLSGAARRLEAIRDNERVSRHLERKSESRQGGFFPPPEDSPIRRAISLERAKAEAAPRDPRQ